MNGIILFEDEGHADFGPLVYWRSVCELRVGRKLMLDRVAQRLGAPIAGVWTREWLAVVAAQRCGAPANKPAEVGTVLINSRWLIDEVPNFDNAPVVGEVDGAIAYVVCDTELASNLNAIDLLEPDRRAEALANVPRQDASGSMIHHPWDIVAALGDLLASDWCDHDAGIESPLPTGLVLDNPDRVHIGVNTSIHPTAIIDTVNGTVYISHDVSIGPYAIIEGPAYLGPGTQVNAHAWLHGGVTLGPCCKVGGEIDRCLFHGYSNKQHHGFLGHSIVGSWVNLGAGCTNSDLKNTYGNVRAPLGGREIDTGRMFVGAVIADHAKIGINATIPTGGVIGFAATVAATRVLPKNVPSFAWVTENGITGGDPARLLDVATKVMVRRDIDMTDEEIELFLNLGSSTPEMEQSNLSRPRPERSQLVR